MKYDKEGKSSVGSLLVPVKTINNFILVYWDWARVGDVADSLNQVYEAGNHSPCRVNGKSIKDNPAMNFCSTCMKNAMKTCK